MPGLKADENGHTLKSVKVFIIEWKSLYYVKTPSVYYSVSRWKRLEHMSVVEQSIHFLKNVATEEDALFTVDYEIPSQTRTNHQLFTKVAVKIPQLPRGAKVILHSLVESGRY